MKSLIIGMLLVSTAFAQSPVMEIEDQVNLYTEALERAEQASGKELVMTTFRVRTILEAGVNIPAISKLSINPEIEFIFTKKK